MSWEYSPRVVRKVLLLDDFETVVNAWARRCRALGKMPLPATTPEHALRLAREDQPEAALIDLRLGHHLNGIDVTRKLKAVAPEMFVVIVSADLDAELAVDALRAGANDVLSKDISIDKILEGIETGVRPRPDASTLEHLRLEDVVKAHLLRVLRANDFNVTHTAQALGRSRQTIQSLMRKHGIKRDRKVAIPRRSASKK